MTMLASLLLLIDSQDEKDRFERLYYEYERLMFYVAKKRLGDVYLAEDAVNEAFIRIIKHLDIIEEIPSPRTKRYVVVIVKNVCADMYARKNREREHLIGDVLEHLSEVDGKAMFSGQDIFFQRYDLETISGAIKKLPEIYQVTLYLYIVEDKGWAEIADIMECKIETVKKRIYRARKELRTALEVHDGR